MARIIFTLVLIFIILSVDFYVWNAFKGNLSQKPILKTLFWSISVGSILLVLYPAMNTNMTLLPNYMVVLFGFSFSIFMSKLAMSFPLIVDDLIRFFNWFFYTISDNNDSLNPRSKISRLTFLKNTALAIGGLTLATFSYGIIVGRFDFKKHIVKISLKKFPKGINPIKIVQISDLHLGSFQRKDKLIEAVELINEEKPDFIFFTGDLVNNHASEAKEFVDILAQLNARIGKYSVLGNHDYADYLGLDMRTTEGKKKWMDNHNEMIAYHKNSGFELLLNQHEEIEVNGTKINIVGVENWGDGRFSKYGKIEDAIVGMNTELPTFLLSHDPTHWEKVIMPNDIPIDVQLAGHTHGMQFGFEIAGFKWSPSKWKYKHWAGLYQNQNKYLYVNRGIGHLGYPGRVGILPEIGILEVYST